MSCQSNELEWRNCVALKAESIFWYNFVFKLFKTIIFIIWTMEGNICQKGTWVQAGWKLFPCHHCNLLSICLSLSSAPVPLPLIPISHRTLFTGTLPLRDFAVPLYVVFCKSSSHNMVDFPFGQGSATFQRWACQTAPVGGEESGLLVWSGQRAPGRLCCTETSPTSTFY